MPPKVDEEVKAQLQDKKATEITFTEAEFSSVYEAMLTSLQILELIYKVSRIPSRKQDSFPGALH